MLADALARAGACAGAAGTRAAAAATSSAAAGTASRFGMRPVWH